MPTIEIHGVRPEQAEFLRKRIGNAFKGAPYAGATVIMSPATVVASATGALDAFLRVYITADNANEHLIDMMKRLKPFGYDIEVLEIKVFIPKKR